MDSAYFPPTYNISPPKASAHQRRKKSSSPEEAFRHTPRPTSSGSEATPPLSASSSVSSGSTDSSLHSFPLSFSSVAWSADLAGPSMVISTSPEVYSPPGPASTFTVKPLASTKNATLREVTNSACLPAAPALQDQQLDFNPAADTITPWEHQQFVEGLIGVSMVAIESIWPNQVNTSCPADRPPSSSDNKVLPLHYFVKETLRRSRSSAAVLQTALYYLHKARSKIRARVAAAEAAKERFAYLAKLRQASGGSPVPGCSLGTDEFTAAATEVLATSKDPVICGRRMFLASLIAASKFLQDRTYSNRAWSRLSGLSVHEINANERAFLDVLEYKLSVKLELYQNWCARLRKLQEQQGISSPNIDRAPICRAASEYVPPPLKTDEVHAGRVPVAETPRPIKRCPPPSSAMGRSYSDRDVIFSKAADKPSLKISTVLSPLGRTNSARARPSPLRNSLQMSRRMSIDGTCRPTMPRLPSWSQAAPTPVY